MEKTRLQFKYLIVITAIIVITKIRSIKRKKFFKEVI